MVYLASAWTAMLLVDDFLLPLLVLLSEAKETE